MASTFFSNKAFRSLVEALTALANSKSSFERLVPKSTIKKSKVNGLNYLYRHSILLGCGCDPRNHLSEGVMLGLHIEL